MANRQSVGSILKPPKVRAPLKEIEPVDQDPDDDTASLPKRKVSFSGMNKIKMYNTGATSLTVNQAPMFDEQHLSLLSDSSNTEKTKSSGNLEKSDGQINLESTNCINIENNTPGNTRVIIEYQSPNDNMEMTEVLSSKILSDTIHTIDSNGVVNIDYYSDYSESNMEFTEAIKGGQIILADVESDLSSSNISESSYVEDEEKLMTQFNSIPSHNLPGKNICNISSDSNMDFTCVNKSSIPTNVSYSNTQSSAMELTCMTGKSQNFIWSSEIKDNSESVYEYNQSITMELDTSQEIKENDNYKSESVHNEYAEMPKISNNLNHQNISSLLKNVENNEDIEELSLSVVSMDIDPTAKENEFDISYLNTYNSEMVVKKQTNSVEPTTVEVENIGCSVERVLDVININNQNDKSRTQMGPMDSSLLQETSSKYCLNKSVTTALPKESFHKNTSTLDQNQCLDTDTALIVEENLKKNYSRKTMGRMTPLIVHNKDSNNEDISEMTKDSMQKNYSRKTIAPISVFNQTQSSDDDELSDMSATVGKQEQQNYSRKSIAPISVFNQTQSSDDDELSNISSTVGEQEEHKYSRKSMVPTSVSNQTQSSEDDELSDMSATVEKHEQKSYSRKSTVFKCISDQNQSYGYEEVSNTSAMVEGNKQKSYSRKTFGPIDIMSVQNEISDKSMSDNSLIEESNETNLRDSTSSSVTPVTPNNKSIGSKNNDVLKLNISKQYEENVTKTEKKSILLNENSDDDFNSPFRKKSKKSIIPTCTAKQPIETLSVEHAGEENIPETDNRLDNFENEMDISIEVESKNYITKNISSEQLNLSSSTSLIDTSPTEKITSYSINENKNSSDLQIISNISQKLKENNIKTSDELENNSNDIDRHSDEEINSKSIQIKDDINQINNALNSENQSFGGNISRVANTICTEGVKNISISDEKNQENEKSLIGNRKRSYSERDFQPLLCSSGLKPNVFNSVKYDDFSKEDFLEESPIMKVVTMENIINEESLMENYVEADKVKEELNTEDLVFEVYLFLNKQSKEFDDQKISLEKCTNREWVFSVLDGNINLKISYSPVINKNSSLKVEDISFTTKNCIQNEITNFGINWILSKYNPKFYKQICYSSSDVELLLQSLKKDVDFISQVMQNMYFVRDIHCVTFKDNKAQFVLHDMNSLLMVRFEVLLSNIHKLSVKDISVDCFFGFFDIKILHEIMKNVKKDCNVLMSLIEQLKENFKTPME